MAKIAYPGDLADGETITAAKFNDRFQPLFKTLNATGISGADGLTDDEVEDGAFSPAKVSGTAVTLTADQTITGDKTWNAQTIYTTNTFADADTTPSVAGGTSWTSANTGATSITNFDDGTNGQVMFFRFGDANTTLVNGATIVTFDAANVTTANTVWISFHFDGGKWEELWRAGV